MWQDWFSWLYESETNNPKRKIKNSNSELAADKSEISESRKRDFKVYKACLSAAYQNDIENNREAKIISDELSIIITLARQLGLSQEDVKLINYSILPIKQ
jgi:ferritin-like metal-binding protein YciE